MRYWRTPHVASAYSPPEEERKRSTSTQWWSGCVTQAGSGGPCGEKRLPTSLISPRHSEILVCGGRRLCCPLTTEESPAASPIPVIVAMVRDPGVMEQKAREYGAIAVLRTLMKADELIATFRGVLGKQEWSRKIRRHYGRVHHAEGSTA